MFKSFRRFIVEYVLRPRWVVNSEGEMGVRIFGVCCYYYKYPDPLIYRNNDNETPGWDFARKREFGEVVKSTRQTWTGCFGRITKNEIRRKRTTTRQSQSPLQGDSPSQPIRFDVFLRQH